MSTLTVKTPIIAIPQKEYENLLEAKRIIDKILLWSTITADIKRPHFKSSAFGIFKNDFGKQSSVSYVNTLRKSWRA